MRVIAMLALAVAAGSNVSAVHAQAAGGTRPAPVTNGRTLQSDAALPHSLQQASTYRLWRGRAPGAKSDSPGETPTLTWLAPAVGSNGTAVIIAPGGGYVDMAGVLEGTEPASWFTTRGDQVPPEGSLRFYEALWKRHVPVEMHIFAHGHHASVYGGADPSLSLWPQLLQEWMRRRGLLPPPRP